MIWFSLLPIMTCAFNMGRFRSAGLIPRVLSKSCQRPPLGRRSSVASSTQDSKHQVIFVLGGPGAGKGTQCSMLVHEFGFTHLSAGDLLRKERLSDSENGKLIDNFIREGKIVPVAISLGLLKNAMDAVNEGVFLIDGFPRNADNVLGWDSVMADSAHVLGVLFFDCSQQEQEKRLLSRGLTSGRTDDNLESARKRFRTYEVETRPVVELYERSGLLRRIDAQSEPAVVYEATKPIVDSLLSA
mmetsp:Transcript_59040/g.115848  ORF Transcript_59040/g.115848 Transcript_59040/m.115848 type:complete len:243 (-) Transcript_59040:7-735(-)